MNPISLFTGPYAGLIKLGGILLILASVAGLSAYKMRQHDNIRYDALQADFGQFKATTAALGKAAQERATAQAMSDKLRKENADKDHQRTVATLGATIRGLRDARSGSSFVPAATSCPGSPATAAFNRDILERALRDFDTGIQGLVDEGSGAVISLDNAKRWAQSP